MVFTAIFHNETSENTFLVFDEETKNGIIIDPCCKMEKIDNLIEENGVDVKYILLMSNCLYSILSQLSFQHNDNAMVHSKYLLYLFWKMDNEE